MPQITPMMRQYLEMKKKYPDAILFFRMGDFFEMFGEDAVIASKVLNIVLTKRNTGPNPDMPMAGIPHHAVESYLRKMLEAGYKVALCDQIEDPKKAKGIVKRDVIRVYTPGTLIEDNFLEEKANNYLMGIKKYNEEYIVSFIDVSTGDFKITEISSKKISLDLINEINKFSPSECIVSEDDQELINYLRNKLRLFVTPLPDYYFREDYGESILYDNLRKNVINISRLKMKPKMLSLAGAMVAYLLKVHKNSLCSIKEIEIYSSEDYLVLDGMTPKNLEILENLNDGKRHSTLLSVVDRTATAMGGRLLRKILTQPLKNIKQIRERLDAVEELVNNRFIRHDIQSFLENIADLERISTKISYKKVNPKELVALKKSFQQLPSLKNILSDTSSDLLKKISSDIKEFPNLIKLISDSIVDNPPSNLKDGGIIKEGYSQQLDELRRLSKSGKKWLLKYQESEKRKTGIKSLKIGYNKVFGYYIEVSKANLSLVPDTYIRKQTLTNSERFITEELKHYEEKILTAEEKISMLEYELFESVRSSVEKYIDDILKCAETIAFLDVLTSFASVSADYDYIKPEISNDREIIIKKGRHPVIEQADMVEQFIPNDTYLNGDDHRLILLTGPNMAGKSTYMRQIALIILLAQCGCFVPAEKAKIGIVDKIFTRVGAHDNLTAGQSTFMVEMIETARILENATRDSLIILDEVGRGTSTFDGMSIAWSITEYIHNNISARTIFATHFHELTCLEEILSGLKNYYITVSESKGDIIFLRKVVRGSADRSYGIEVAKLANLPDFVINRASEILNHLEGKSTLTKEKIKTKTDSEEIKMKIRERNIFNNIKKRVEKKQTRLSDFVSA